MKKQAMYNYCITYKMQCKYAKRHGHCSRAVHQRCVQLNRDVKLSMKIPSYGNNDY